MWVGRGLNGAFDDGKNGLCCLQTGRTAGMQGRAASRRDEKPYANLSLNDLQVYAFITVTNHPLHRLVGDVAQIVQVRQRHPARWIALLHLCPQTQEPWPEPVKIAIPGEQRIFFQDPD